jgi:hypothetical protein
MKFFDFWFDLPKALSNIVEENLSKEEMEYVSILSTTSEVNFNVLIY